MKFALIGLLCVLVSVVVCQPVEQSAVVAAAAPVAVEDDPELHDMEGSEDLLKIVYKKLDHWMKKCYKLGGCGGGYGHGGYDYDYAPSYGHGGYGGGYGGYGGYGYGGYGHGGGYGVSPYGYGGYY